MTGSRRAIGSSRFHLISGAITVLKRNGWDQNTFIYKGSVLCRVWVSRPSEARGFGEDGPSW